MDQSLLDSHGDFMGLKEGFNGNWDLLTEGFDDFNGNWPNMCVA